MSHLSPIATRGTLAEDTEDHASFASGTTYYSVSNRIRHPDSQQLKHYLRCALKSYPSLGQSFLSRSFQMYIKNAAVASKRCSRNADSVMPSAAVSSKPTPASNRPIWTPAATTTMY